MADRTYGAALKQKKASRTEGRKETKEKMGKEKMPTVWFALKKSLHCKSEPSDVYDPKRRGHMGTILTRKAGRSGCSRSIANLKDVIHGSKRDLERPSSCSPRSIGSNEFLNPITHEVILSNSRCELRITGFGGCPEGDAALGSTYVGTLRPGTPGPGGHYALHSTPSHRVANTTPPRKSPTLLVDREGHGFGSSPLSGFAMVSDIGGVGFHHAASTPRFSHEADSQTKRPSVAVTCHKCGEHFGKLEALESHHLSKHAVSWFTKHLSCFFNVVGSPVFMLQKFDGDCDWKILRFVHLGLTCLSSVFSVVTELVEGDSSRKIVEIICRASWLKPESSCIQIDRILKVHNMQKTLATFEEYRELVKNKASRLAKKHPRCLADGNELLRFYGTTIACSLGTNGSSRLCSSEKCSVCRIIRHGFSTRREVAKGGIGVFTTSTSGRAFQTIQPCEDDDSMKKALLVCRVIAGRVHKPLDNYQELAGQSGFDSVAGKLGLYANIEELYLLNPRALLPCFVVICRT
ncbi:hypothetical protein B296_00008975 [Ensete ventricosum]|uniref:C2H2-type domain-containing protein n=1 Tax=Ensete ventricosum TaxID=4639 RepID=A0A427APP9_ENSVE|nr:hypothetical protein B296_00008975 [Ensete ventricosum]